MWRDRPARPIPAILSDQEIGWEIRNMGLFGKETGLPGRTERMPIAERHFVTDALGSEQERGAS